jgi:hypothetical protein
MKNSLFSPVGPVPFIDDELKISLVPIISNINARFIIVIALILTRASNTVITESEGLTPVVPKPAIGHDSELYVYYVTKLQYDLKKR